MSGLIIRRAEIDRYWADFMVCSVDQLYEPGVTFTYSENVRGILALAIEQTQRLIIHPALRYLEPHFVRWTKQKAPILPADIEAALTDYTVYECYGPGPVSYLNPHEYQPIDESGCRLLTNEDARRITDFEVLAGWTEADAWPAPGVVAQVGICDGDRLVAMCRVYAWSGLIGSMKAFVHPRYRGRGLGRAVIGAATRWMVEESDLIPQYDTDANNHGSQRICEQLGYIHYGYLTYGKIVLADEGNKHEQQG